MARLPVAPTARPQRHTAAKSQAAPRAVGIRAKAGDWIESTTVQTFILGVILLNSIILGMQTSRPLVARIGGAMHVIDTICLAIFVVEIAFKLYAYGLRFFRDPWNVFDFVVVGIALIPGSGALAVLRAFRVLRVLRLVSSLPKLRNIVSTLLAAIPGISAIAGLLCIIFYLFAVMSTGFFGERFPQWFGSIGGSLYSLFQIMTLESWSMGIVRPVMEVYPWAWALFVPFILLSAFTILNLFIAVIIDTMQSMHDEREVAAAKAEQAAQERVPLSDEEILQEISKVSDQLAELTATLAARGRESARVRPCPEADTGDSPQTPTAS